MVPLRVPCPSKPSTRVGGGRWMTFRDPFTLVREHAPGQVYVLRPGAPEWVLVPEARAISEAVEYLRDNPDGTCEGPSQLIDVICRQAGLPSEFQQAPVSKRGYGRLPGRKGAGQPLGQP